MPDLTIRDVDEQLIDRVRRLSVAQGWTQHQTLLALLEAGLRQGEAGELHSEFVNTEQQALDAAIAALKALP